MLHEPLAIFGSDPDTLQRTTHFSGCAGIVSAVWPADVVPALRRVEAAVQEGMYAVGFLAYEAAGGIEPSLSTKDLSDFPLLWFALFRECRERPFAECFDTAERQPCELPEWRASLTEQEYLTAVACIKDYIASGDSYQVNFTFRQHCNFSGSVQQLFLDLYNSQPTRYCSFLDIGHYAVLSVSPELFFQIESGCLTVKPMKGTAGRGRWAEEDSEKREKLRGSEKERAENLMIVDLLRNDLGRISASGSVEVVSLFDVETHETIHQMTSTITSRLGDGVDLVELFQALFPCGSVTGAPKRRSMEIIAELETSPRGIYTGCIGYISPGMARAVFNVAIRTVIIDKETGTACMGVGSGITWGSAAGEEYEECFSKARFALGRTIPEFTLIESILYDVTSGYFLLERHLERMRRSAGYFGFALDLSRVRSELEDHVHSCGHNTKVRLLLSRNGSFFIEDSPLSGLGETNGLVVSIAETRVDSENPFLYHKTSNRGLYEQELRRRPDCADIIFLNERDEVTEGATSNIVLRRGQNLVTPSLDCGLLPGTFRAQLLAEGVVKEAVVTRRELEHAGELFLVNSVRKWRRVRLVS